MLVLSNDFFIYSFLNLFSLNNNIYLHRRTIHYVGEFKQIATAGAYTAAGSKCPQKCDTAHVRRLHPTVARNLTT